MSAQHVGRMPHAAYSAHPLQAWWHQAFVPLPTSQPLAMRPCSTMLLGGTCIFKVSWPKTIHHKFGKDFEYACQRSMWDACRMRHTLHILCKLGDTKPLAFCQLRSLWRCGPCSTMLLKLTMELLATIVALFRSLTLTLADEASKCWMRACVQSFIHNWSRPKQWECKVETNWYLLVSSKFWVPRLLSKTPTSCFQCIRYQIRHAVIADVNHHGLWGWFLGVPEAWARLHENLANPGELWRTHNCTAPYSQEPPQSSSEGPPHSSFGMCPSLGQFLKLPGSAELKWIMAHGWGLCGSCWVVDLEWNVVKTCLQKFCRVAVPDLAESE